MAKRTNEFRQERIDFERFQKNGAKEIAPYFRKALKQSIKPTIEYAQTFGLEALSMVLIPPISTNIWERTYLDTFNLLGMRMAKKEFYRQRNLDAKYEEKASAIELLIDVWTSLLRDYALTYTYRIARELNDTTIKIIKEALGDSLELGLDWDGSIRIFEKLLNGKMKTRTGTISRTEATTISNLGKAIGAQSYIDSVGGQGYKVWIGRNDDRERPTHINENDTLIPLDDMFELEAEGEKIDFCIRPGDIDLRAENRINCRCTLSYLSQNRYNYYLKRGRIINGRLVGASGNRNS